MCFLCQVWAAGGAKVSSQEQSGSAQALQCLSPFLSSLRRSPAAQQRHCCIKAEMGLVLGLGHRDCRLEPALARGMAALLSSRAQATARDSTLGHLHMVASPVRSASLAMLLVSWVSCIHWGLIALAMHCTFST